MLHSSTYLRTWLCICEDRVRRSCSRTPKYIYVSYLTANPGYKCVVKRGKDLFQQWPVDQIKRDTDFMYENSCNDQSGYSTGGTWEHSMSCSVFEEEGLIVAALLLCQGYEILREESELGGRSAILSTQLKAPRLHFLEHLPGSYFLLISINLCLFASPYPAKTSWSKLA